MSIVEKALEKLKQRRAELAARQPEPTYEATFADAALLTESVPEPLARTRPMLARPRLELELEQLAAAGLLPPPAEERRLAEEMRQVKRPLVARALAAPADGSANENVIMVASAVEGEGKTFTAFNLALSLSFEHDVSVLLIDADLPKPQISTVLGIKDRKGLLDALTRPDLDVESLIHDTDRPTLGILGAGTHSEKATELLASQRMSELIAQLRMADPRRIIVFDSPPLLLTTESRELATLAGQVVLVIRAGETPQQAVFDAVALLGSGKHVGLMLNQVVRDGGDSAYLGYGQYGNYGESRDPP